MIVLAALALALAAAVFAALLVVRLRRHRWQPWPGRWMAAAELLPLLAESDRRPFLASLTPPYRRLVAPARFRVAS